MAIARKRESQRTMPPMKQGKGRDFAFAVLKRI
jgi:hypothetical protein